MSLRLTIPRSKNQWFLLLLGGAAVAVSAIPVAHGVRSLAWPRVDAVITHSRETVRNRRMTPDIGYRYTLGGRSHTGNRYRYQSLIARVRGRDVQSIVGKHRPGDRVQVAVDPDDPDDSVLFPGVDFESLVPLGLGLLLVLLGVGQIRKDETRAVVPRQRRRSRLATVLACLGWAVLLFGAWQIYRGIASTSWPAADGRVVYSHARTGSAYETMLWYEYFIDQRRYLASNYRNGGNASPFRSVAENAAKRYPEGRAVKVYYNPANPAEALLEPGVWWGNFVAPIVGAILLGAAWLAKKYAEIMAARRTGP